MAPTTFSTALLVFINLWLIAITTFGTAASAIFLYILGAVDNVTASSVAVSVLCSALSFIYLVLQSINASVTRPESWLCRATIQLPRVLIVCWIVTTTIALVVALRQPLCQSEDVKADAAAWQAGLGCWVFRVLVSLDVVMLVLSFIIFILLEINGRHVPLGLFHFEFAASPAQLHRRRRRTLVTSAYGSTVSLNSPVTITSEDETHLTGSAEKRPRTHHGHGPSDATVSPSPTYRTFDLSSIRLGRRLRTGTGTGAGKDRSRSALDEESILDLSTSRQSSCTTATLATLPLTHFSSTPTPAAPHPYPCPTHDLFASGHLQSRRLSSADVPALPPSFQLQLKELERLKADHTAKTIPTTPTTAGRPALYTHTSKSNVKSSCALPLSSRTPSGSVDLGTMLKEQSAQPASEERRSETDVERPAPAWCPAALKERSMPLSADPAIKRLTEFRAARTSTTVSRRLSFSGFEFGFGASRRATHEGAGSTSAGTGRDSAAAAAGAGGCRRTEGKSRAGSVSAAEGKENVRGAVTQVGKDAEAAGEKEAKQSGDKIMNRQKPFLGHGKRTTAAAAGRGASVSAFPPVTAPPVPSDRGVLVGHGRKGSVGVAGAGGSRRRGKSMVERGRYERLPR